MRLPPEISAGTLAGMSIPAKALVRITGAVGLAGIGLSAYLTLPHLSELEREVNRSHLKRPYGDGDAYLAPPEAHDDTYYVALSLPIWILVSFGVITATSVLCIARPETVAGGIGRAGRRLAHEHRRWSRRAGCH